MRLADLSPEGGLNKSPASSHWGGTASSAPLPPDTSLVRDSTSLTASAASRTMLRAMNQAKEVVQQAHRRPASAQPLLLHQLLSVPCPHRCG